jgi:predicted RNA-binding protein with RPS1 domain
LPFLRQQGGLSDKTKENSIIELIDSNFIATKIIQVKLQDISLSVEKPKENHRNTDATAEKKREKFEAEYQNGFDSVMQQLSELSDANKVRAIGKIPRDSQKAFDQGRRAAVKQHFGHLVRRK